ncbi:glutamate synthase-related protein [Desulfospira joergensenii]|uniref:glutamate synthase-related protein n=1 Tax=Desulfospira joergensenii TaxID=53329 RepID=UPI0003B57DEE|nr:glutamate synthase-related protein [Desulfospira joergensenii]
MPKKYSIPVHPAPPRQYPVGKYTTIEFRENCAGSCRKCVKKECVYGIFKDNYLHMSAMEDPEYLYTCNSCFRCVQECTKGIFSRAINPEYRIIGDDYWTPHIINRTWYQAQTGSIPVSGAGYGGPFTGKGFDSMWTDMSEIVRPTRDGIHGREYINTSIELSKRSLRLAFTGDGALATQVPEILEIPIPILFNQPDFGLIAPGVLLSMVRAAHDLGTLIFMETGEITREMAPYAEALIPRLASGSVPENEDLIRACRMVEIRHSPGLEADIRAAKAINPGLFIAVGLDLKKDAARTALEIARLDVDTLHFYADSHGREQEPEKARFLRGAIRDIHLILIENALRLKVNLVFSGGIAMAEHVAKAVICGADGVAVDNTLLISLECRMCGRCTQGLSCPAALEEVEPDFGSKRITNLISAWRNQLLEVMGAMGLREARRLRGEVGRSMWFEDLEKNHFGPIFGERKVAY